MTRIGGTADAPAAAVNAMMMCCRSPAAFVQDADVE
jgi:hypothetical protein